MGTGGESRFYVNVIEAIARAEGVRPRELTFTLHEHINTDALELLAEDGSHWELSFEVPRHEVTVMSDRTVIVDGEFVV